MPRRWRNGCIDTCILDLGTSCRFNNQQKFKKKCVHINEKQQQFVHLLYSKSPIIKAWLIKFAAYMCTFFRRFATLWRANYLHSVHLPTCMKQLGKQRCIFMKFYTSKLTQPSPKLFYQFQLLFGPNYSKNLHAFLCIPSA